MYKNLFYRANRIWTSGRSPLTLGLRIPSGCSAFCFAKLLHTGAGWFKKNIKHAIILAMNRIFLVSFFSLILFAACSRIPDSAQDKKEKSLHRNAGLVAGGIISVQSVQDKAVKEYVKNSSLHDKVCQLFIENIEGDTVYVPVEKNYIPGGYLFFSYNLAETPAGIMKFTDSIRSYCLDHKVIPPFLAVDQEGGFVNRLRTVNGPLPSAKRVAEKLSVQDAYKLYSYQARQMKALGFNMNIAPVVEIQTPENEAFLDGRSFGSFLKVRSYGIACVNAYENRGIGAVIKHFPGNTNTDPHTGLPEIQLSEAELEESLKHFNQLSRISPSGALMSHARTKAVDSGVPACFSKNWVTDRLRNQYGFEGIIFSDDIFMGALANNGYPPETAAEKAVEAGVNCIMISEKRFSKAAEALIKRAKADKEFASLIDSSFEKIIRYKLKSGILDFYDDGGKLLIKAKEISGSIDDRCAAFDKARKENIELYITYF